MHPTSTTERGFDQNHELIVCFGEFELDSCSQSLARGDDRVTLSATPFKTLEFLVRNRHRIISKTELLKEVWGGVQERNTVEQAIGKIRRALGEGPTEG